MTTERQYEERCPLWCRFFVRHTTNFAPCAARDELWSTFNAQQTTLNTRQTMPEALKSVVDVPRETFEAHRSTFNVRWAMKYEQCFMFQ